MHAPMPTLCPDCLDRQHQVAADTRDGLAIAYCPHNLAMARCQVAGGFICHSVVDGPVSAEDAARQIDALDRDYASKAGAVTIATGSRH